MNWFAFSSILICVSSFSIGFFVLARGQRKKLNLIWASFCFAVGLWGIGAFKFSTTTVKEVAFLWWQIGFLGAIFTPVFYYHFVSEFLKRKDKYIISVQYVLAGIFGLISIFRRDVFYGDLRWVFNQFYWVDWHQHQSKIFLSFYLLFYVGILGLAFYRMIVGYKYVTGIQRNQLKYFIITSMLSWPGTEGLFLPTFRIDIYPYYSFLIILYPLIIGFTIVRYRLMDIRVAITRAGISLVVYSSLLGIPFYIGYRTESWILSTSAAIMFSLPAPFIYRYFSVKAENILLAQQRHYQKILLQAASGMVQEHNLSRLLKLIVYIIKRAVNIRYAAIYFHDKDNKTYVMSAKRDSGDTSFNLNIEEDSPLINYMRRYQNPFLPEEVPFKLRKTFFQDIGEEFDLIVPSIVNDEILGFMVLGAKLDRSPYTPDDINVFRILSHQGALAIENCMFFEEFRTVQQELFQAEKLASIGGLADGVAHQIKNRLNHFSLASGELKLAINDFLSQNQHIADDEKCREIFDYLTKIATSIIDNVKRTDDIVKGILNFTRTTEKDTFFGYFAFSEMIETIMSLLLIKHEKDTVPIEILPESIETIWGIKAQLNEVIYNLLDNAYEATEELTQTLTNTEKEEYQAKITIKVEDMNDHYLITITDNGIGIKEEDKPKVFAPFFTTKSSYKSGSGIGMYVARRIIEENHTGSIKLESEYTKGTTIRIEIPKPQK
ncbi:MAG: GAF domain-containing protein [Candidatus Omnitrophica bacterium]|nr:GAF domain-containing protein [Candidatus Omnitrophota bacterium]